MCIFKVYLCSAVDDVSDACTQLLVGLDLLLQAQLFGAQHVQLVRDPRQEFLLKEKDKFVR